MAGFDASRANAVSTLMGMASESEEISTSKTSGQTSSTALETENSSSSDDNLSFIELHEMAASRNKIVVGTTNHNGNNHAVGFRLQMSSNSSLVVLSWDLYSNPILNAIKLPKSVKKDRISIVGPLKCFEDDRWDLVRNLQKLVQDEFPSSSQESNCSRNFDRP